MTEFSGVFGIRLHKKFARLPIRLLQLIFKYQNVSRICAIFGSSLYDGVSDRMTELFVLLDVFCARLGDNPQKNALRFELSRGYAPRSGSIGYPAINSEGLESLTGSQMAAE